MTSRKSLAHNRLPKDRILYCERCGISFLWSGEEQQLAVRPAARAVLEVESGDDAEDPLDSRVDELLPLTKPSGKSGTAKVPTHCAGCRVLMPAKDRERGIVKWYNPRKRFGFITRDDGTEIFAHGSRLENVKRLRDEQLVEFRTTKSKQGPAATEIHVLALDESTLDMEDGPDGEPKTESVTESIRQALSKNDKSRGKPVKGNQSRGRQVKENQPQENQTRGDQAGGSQAKEKRSKGKRNQPQRKRPKSKPPQERAPKKKNQTKDSSKT